MPYTGNSVKGKNSMPTYAMEVIVLKLDLFMASECN